MFNRIGKYVLAIACAVALSGARSNAALPAAPQAAFVNAVAGTSAYVWAQASSTNPGQITVANPTNGKPIFAGTALSFSSSVDANGNILVSILASGYAFDAQGRYAPGQARLDITKTANGHYMLSASVSAMTVTGAKTTAVALQPVTAGSVMFR
jgi:hypothetical protein